MTTSLASLLAGRRAPIPGLPQETRAAEVRTFAAATLVLSDEAFGLGPAHCEFEVRFGRPRPADKFGLPVPGTAKPLPARIARQIAPPQPAPARAAPGEAPAKVEAVLRRGGLWRENELGEELGISAGLARHALRILQDGGKAVHVTLGHWRSRFRSVDLFVDGRTPGARLVGLALAGLSVPACEMAEHLDIPESEARAQAESLVNQGHLRKVGSDLYQCPVDMRERIVAAMGPEMLSELGARIVDALSCGRSLRKTDIALTVGVGRGSANRMVDRLVEDGWLAERESGAFALA